MTDAKLSNNGPAIVLVHPQMGENIGAAARAMLNFGLTDLRLVNPRDGWPSAAATAMAAGALEKMPPARLFETAAASIADCHCVYATTARRRDMRKPVLTARETAADMRARHDAGQRTAILFGAERSGLENDDVALAHAVVTVPLNPDFSSLNLGQSVLLLAYEWFQATPEPAPALKADEAPAEHGALLELFERLEAELDARHFFRSGGHKPIMIRNLRNMLSRSGLTDQEVRSFHGIITALTGGKMPGQ